MFFRNYPILRLLIPFALGIGLAYWSQLELSILIVLWTMFACWLISLGLQHKKTLTTTLFSGIFLQILFVFAGFCLTCICFRNKNSEFYEKIFENNQNFVVKIIEPPIQKAKSIKTTTIIEQTVDGSIVKQKAVLYFGKDSLRQPMFGDVVLIHAKIKEIENSKNPYVFDYKKYMQRKGIFYTAYVPASGWQKIGQFHVNPIKEKAHQIQHYFSQIFANAGMNGDEYSIITAILLGNDETMDPTLKASYASAGVSHILCVSGMHVGVIFMILNFLLQPLEYSRPLRLLKAVLLMLFIWVYACITGLSPSVTRAATMFSFVTIGNMLRRNTNIFHSLFASLFILLIINPLLIFEIGFQLSYAAVFGIVIFQQKLVALWEPKRKIINYFWNLITVSVAAQLATFPLSVYTFGQFPNYFLLANLSVISLSFLVVVSGVCLLAVSFIPIVSSWIAWLLTHEIRLMNFLIQSIEKLPGAVTENISISWGQMLLIYLCIIAFYLLFWKKKRYYWLGISSILCLILLFDVDKYQTQHIESQTVYNLSKGVAVSFNYHGKAVIFSDSIRDKSHPDYDYCIKNHERKERIESVIIPIDSNYQNEFLLKHGDFVVFCGKTYHLARRGRRYYPTSNKIFVDEVLFLEDYIRMEYLEKAVVCSKL
ncbi:MAG: ComEC/Rec2 family competence protein [Bacteroidales bacterium]|nr:ComEC/Rec2 family competence protein [Bacteroidales bacterium]